MRRWMLPIVAVALLVPAAIADDSSDSTPRPASSLTKKKKPEAKQAKVVRVVVLEEAQPVPADPSAAPAPAPAPSVGTPGVIITGPVTIAPAEAACNAGGSSDGSKAARHHGLFAKKPRHSEDCVGCGSFCYEMWYAFSSCRSFFGEGPYAPRYPESCPTCDFGCKHKK
jgi:hypothetical protein